MAPPEHLVVGGLYRHVRNPMYVAVAATIVGQAALLGRPALLLYALAFMAVVARFVYGYEQPVLSERFGADYDALPAQRPGLVAAPASLDGGASRVASSGRPSDGGA